jgi:hypothetical protein
LVTGCWGEPARITSARCGTKRKELTDLASTAFPDARSIALSQMQIDSAVKLIKRQAEKMQ